MSSPTTRPRVTPGLERSTQNCAREKGGGDGISSSTKAVAKVNNILGGKQTRKHRNHRGFHNRKW